jgi:hypothetical protein
MVDRFAAAEVDVEQPVIGRAARQGERLIRPAEWLPCCAPARSPPGTPRLFRRHSEAIDAQQRDKGHEDAGRMR